MIERTVLHLLYSFLVFYTCYLMEYAIPDGFFGFVCLIGLFVWLFVWFVLGLIFFVCLYIYCFLRSKSLLCQSYVACENLIVIGQS